ncbi:MAG: hypothetical protein ACI378_08920, partial [Bacteroides sp.]
IPHSSTIKPSSLSRSRPSSVIDNHEINAFSLVVAHEQLGQLIADAKLEEWNVRQGLAEEEAEAGHPVG